MSSRAFAARARELAGVTSPSEMLRSHQRKHYPSLGLLPRTRRSHHMSS